MNQSGSDRPVPPEGAQSAPPVTPPSTPPVTNQSVPKAKQPKSKDSKGGLRSFLYGLLGGVVSVALVLCLGSFTPVLDAFKGATVTSSNGNVVISPDEDDVTLAEAVAAKCLGSVATIYVYSDSASSNRDEQLLKPAFLPRQRRRHLESGRHVLHRHQQPRRQRCLARDGHDQ